MSTPGDPSAVTGTRAATTTGERMVDGQGRPKLKRGLGLWMATALVLGNVIGSGVFLLPASLAEAAGPVAILSWVVTGFGALMLALVFAGLGRAFPRTGGPYAYVREAFGEFPGFQTAWGYWIMVWSGNAAIAVAFVGYLSVFFPPLAENIWGALAGIAAVWLLTGANIIGVREGGVIQLVTAILKFVPLLIISVLGLFFIRAENFTPFAPEGFWTGITAGAALTLWAFLGLESATVPAEEVENPERNIPLATIIGTGAATVVYLLATVSITGIVPRAQLAESSSPFADAARTMFGGEWAAQGIAVVALISTFGALNGWILLQGRVPLAAATDGLFPRIFGRVHDRWRTPVFGLVVSSVLVSLLMLMNYSGSDTLVEQFNFALLLATLSALIPYAYSAAAQILFLVTRNPRFSTANLVRDVVVAGLAFAYSIYAMIGAGNEVIALGFLLIVLGVPVYLFLKWREHRERQTAPAPTADGSSGGA